MTFKRNMEEQIDFKIMTLSVNSREFDFSDFKDIPIKQNSFMKKVLESYPSDFNEEELDSIEELFRLTTIYYQKKYSTFNFAAIEFSVFEDFVRSNSKFLEISANIKNYDNFLSETKPFFPEGTDNAVVEFVFKNIFNSENFRKLSTIKRNWLLLDFKSILDTYSSSIKK